MADNPKGPGTGKANQQTDDKAKGPVGLEELAQQLNQFTSEVTKQVQGIRQLVNQRDEDVRATLESLAGGGRRSRSRRRVEEDDEYDEDDSFEEDDYGSRRRRRRHPLMRRVERVEEEARARDDLLMQQGAISAFLTESDPGDPEKGIPPENRQRYLPKIEEILQDKARAGRFVHRTKEGEPDYKITLENVYQHLQLSELRQAQAEAAKNKKSQDQDRARLGAHAVISGGGSDEADDERPDTSGMTSDEMLEAGLAPVDPDNPPPPLGLGK